ncbi:MAG TPA: MdtA/MuxA family multidrug efflux RND transporter periplasmic adaptor subunit [Dissulfurispiraceae bacterium]|nr:MdtA/MuxA family multidrug efflux RND transporter periplasmic adaptor subunit [Dissulfurispiraceae bacterium]
MTQALYRRRWVWVLVCFLAVGAYVLMHRAGGPQSPAAKKGASAAAGSVPVVAEAAKKGNIGVYLNGLGTVTSLNTVTVQSRVAGELMRVLFKEGQIVNSGDLLAEIDPRPYEAQLTQAEGQLMHDEALLKDARIDLERYRILAKQDSIPKQQLDTQEYLVLQDEGAVKTDQGNIANAKLQLIYSRITSPISGRVGLRQVDPGNIIQTTATTGIVVITQLQPITVIFPIPEDNISQVLGKLGSGARLQVEAFDREQKKKLDGGYLLTVDNQIDTTSGTVKLKALFPNKDNQLFPNQFVNARLLVEMKTGAVLIPESAIQRGPQGTYVFVVKADHTAQVRPVTVGLSEEGNVSITSGLSPAEIVVIDGAERLRDGSKVELPGQNGSNRQTGENASKKQK